MVEFSLFERNRIANNLFGGADFEIRAYSDTISSTGTGGTEIDADGYEPIEIENDTTNFPTATTGARTNAVAFQKQFTEAATIASMAVFSSGGDFLARIVPSSPLEVGGGEYWRFPIGSITFTPSNPS